MENEPITPEQINRLEQCRLIQLPKIKGPPGSLTFVENSKQIPFDIKRVYYIYDIPGGTSRGSHAHRSLSQVLIAATGSFTVNLDDGREKKSFFLNLPFIGLYISSMVWHDMNDFSRDSVCLTLASEIYDESDYFRDYDDFLGAVSK